MGRLIKFLIVSFPFVFAAFVFLPVVGQSSSQAPTSEKPRNTDSSRPLRDVAKEEAASSVASVRSQGTQSPSGSSIYRWVDENGTVVFSDRPAAENAVSHTPDEIGYISATGFDRPQNTTQTKTVLASVAKSQQTKKSSPIYIFSTLDANQHKDYVVLTGRISNGQRCEKLLVAVTARSDSGKLIRGRDEIDYSGFGSRLYEIKIRSGWKGNSPRPHWQTEKVQVRCL